MLRNFWKAVAVSAGAYATAILFGYVADFRLALFSILALQVTWTLFCLVRLAQLRRGGAYKQDAEPYARQDYGFALGGSVSSLTLFAAIAVITQIV
jgi:hypothetical protein